MKLKELFETLGDSVEVALVIDHPYVYCAHTVQGYAGILAAALNDSTMDGKATGVSVMDGMLWVNVEVGNNADS